MRWEEGFRLFLKTSKNRIWPWQFFYSTIIFVCSRGRENANSEKDLGLIDHHSTKRETTLSGIIQSHPLPSLTLSGYLADAESTMTAEIWRPIDTFLIARWLSEAPVGWSSLPVEQLFWNGLRFMYVDYSPEREFQNAGQKALINVCFSTRCSDEGLERMLKKLPYHN
jgi:hypothetical protein